MPRARKPGALFSCIRTAAPCPRAWPLRTAELAVFHPRIRNPSRIPGIPHGSDPVRGKGAPRMAIPVRSHSASSMPYVGAPIMGGDDNASSMQRCVGTPRSANGKGNQARRESGCDGNLFHIVPL